MLKLHVIICSTRPTRVGPSVARWFDEVARAHGGFDVTLVDLAEPALPMFDEPEHPMLRRYRHDHTKRWSALIDAADAFVLVTPEYNYGPPPPLLNALNYLYHEWHCKPVGFVSYGGISGGCRAVQVEKQTLTTLKMMPLPEAVTIPFVSKQIGEDKRFEPTDGQRKSAQGMLDELQRWAQAMRPLRAPADASK